jgi:signal transduction histidine kinase
LKFESLQDLVSRVGMHAAPGAEDYEGDLETIRTALTHSLRHIRGVAGNLLPSDFEDLSVVDVLARAARQHQRRTGAAVAVETRDLPEQLPFPIKACLYRFALESLDGMPDDADRRTRSLCAACEQGKIVLEVRGGQAAPAADLPQAAQHTTRFVSLRDRIEAAGGKLRLAPTATGEFALVAELNFSEIEQSGG